jgi:hypothetical protein
MYTGITELLSHFNFMMHDSITPLYAPCLQILTHIAFEITICQEILYKLILCIMTRYPLLK